jgi:hypothetical protein
MNIQLNNSERRIMARFGLPLTGLCLLLLSACSTTQKVALNPSVINCAFFGNDCALLTPVEGEDRAGLRYINPAAKWTQYSKIMIDLVTFLGRRFHTNFSL